MATRHSTKPPSYRLHKASGQAVVTIARKDHYLGVYGSPESRVRYERLISQWVQGETPLSHPQDSNPSDLTVVELCSAYLRWAESYYLKHGNPTSELPNVKRAIRALRETYPSLPAKDFSPLKLRQVRERLISDGLCRGSVNRYASHIVRIFSWGVERELVPPSIVHGLREVKALQRGRSAAPETDPVRPVSDRDVEGTLPFLAEPYSSMVRFQLITGARPGEVCAMTLGEIDRSGPVWIYRPTSHKSIHRDKDRIIPIGPRAQFVIRPFLPDFPGQFVFRSRRGRMITATVYRGAIADACRKAGVPRWSPNQLRHSAATKIREQASLDAAQVVLGHSSIATTQVYAEKNLRAALDIAAKIG